MSITQLFKKNVLSPQSTLIFLLAVTSNVSAASGLSSVTPGLHGYFAVLAGFTQLQSQFNINDYPVTDNLNATGDANSKTIAAPAGQLRYVLNDTSKEYYMGTGREDIARGSYHFEMGYKERLNNGTGLSFGIIPGLIAGQTWEDPFVTGTDREKTSTNLQALRLKANTIASTPLSVSFIYGRRAVEDEHSGDSILPGAEQDLLKRDAILSSLETGYRLNLSGNSYLTSRLSLSDGNADGAAMSYEGYGIEFNYIRILPRGLFSLSVSGKKSHFNEKHPVYDEKRKDKRYGLMAILEYKKPFNLQQWSSIFIASSHKTQSNLNFYDRSSNMIAWGMKYRF